MILLKHSTLGHSNVLLDGITETLKHEIKKKEGGFLPVLIAPLMQPVISSVV